MARLVETAQTLDLKGIREDLANIISNISPSKTPFMQRCGRVNVSNRLFEWQTDALAAAVSTNKHIEGDDLAGAYTAIVPTVRVGNYVQISRKTVSISGTSEAVDKAGRNSELAYQIQKLGLELRRDMETTLLSNQNGYAGAVATASQTAGLCAWVKTNDLHTDGNTPTYTSGVPTGTVTGAGGTGRTDGTAAAFTETMLKTVIKSCYTNGAEPNIIMVGPFNKAALSAFTGIATQTYDISTPRPTAIIASANVYVSNFGTFEVIPNRFQRDRDAWLLDFDYLDVAFLRNFTLETMAKTGDAENRMLLVEYGLKVKNEAALGLCADLTTS